MASDPLPNPDPAPGAASGAAPLSDPPRLRLLFERALDAPVARRGQLLRQLRAEGCDTATLARLERMLEIDDRAQEGAQPQRWIADPRRRRVLAVALPMVVAVGIAGALTGIRSLAAWSRERAHPEPPESWFLTPTIPAEARLSEPGLPTEWDRDAGGDGRWCQYIAFTGAEWTLAESVQRRALRLGGSLARVESAEESAFVRSLVPEACSALVAGGSIGGGPLAGFVVEWSADCNGNGRVDFAEIRAGSARDDNGDGVPDECGR